VAFLMRLFFILFYYFIDPGCLSVCLSVVRIEFEMPKVEERWWKVELVLRIFRGIPIELCMMRSAHALAPSGYHG